MIDVRFSLSLRNVEDLLFERSSDISQEMVRCGCYKLARCLRPTSADNGCCRRRVPPLDWHLDEMSVSIGGEIHHLWRAVEQEGEILGGFVTKNRDKKAAVALNEKAPKHHGLVNGITTDGLRSYGAAMDKLGNRDKQEIGRWANNRVENSHLPFRRRNRAMLSFLRIKSRQRCTSVHASLHDYFATEHHLADRQTYKQTRSVALAEWHSLAA